MKDRTRHTINDYYQLSQYHMKLAYIMRKHHKFKTSLFLCHSALIAMIRAMYIYENKSRPDSEISLIELLLLLHTDYNPGLEIMVFVGKLNYIVHETESLEALKEKEMDRLMEKTEEILTELCSRMANGTSTER
ncbi:HEPN domain-containing protein [Paenibacillus sp. S150]|uniref:HEPN domain-containing protein n=1 Tax=Paenibacillus sp. S150 TaxID=2749826 RepID=UPI001C5974D7|nr:HEPN domain-containing protein [Paenibacillus sp. S150]MBW4081451.1 HEPN domain-containing protein [Paenibacillus sp. S150]